MKRSIIYLFLFLGVFSFSACRLAPDASSQAATLVAGTAAVINQTAAAASPTPIPPTSTPRPTATNTPLPTETPTITPTPGPFSFTDDFSQENKRSWSACPLCEWKKDQLYMGPFEAGNGIMDNLNFVLCEVCGSRKYYHMSVDVIYIKGQVDRFFGVIGGVSKQHIYFLGVSPWQVAIVIDYDFGKGVANVLKSDTKLVKAGKATNHLEITVQPGSDPTLSDISFFVNGTKLKTVFNQPTGETMTGFGITFHAVAAAYDNFVYEELQAGK